MIQAVGFLAGALTTIAFIPQVARTWRTRSTGDLSLPMSISLLVLKVWNRKPA